MTGVTTFIIFLFFTSGSTGLSSESELTIEQLHDELHRIESKNEFYTNEMQDTLKSFYELICNGTVNEMFECRALVEEIRVENETNSQLADKAFDMNKLLEVHYELKSSLQHNADDLLNSTSTLGSETDDKTNCVEADLVNKQALMLDELQTSAAQLKDDAQNVAEAYEVMKKNANMQLDFLEKKAKQLQRQKSVVYTLHKLVLASIKVQVSNAKIRNQRKEQLNKLEQKVLRIRYPNRFHTIRGQSYFIEMDREVTWDEALSACESYGGYLAEINTKKERKELKHLFEKKMRRKKIYIDSLWVGMKHHRKDWGAWVWYHSNQGGDSDVFKKMTRIYVAKEWECVTVRNYGYAIVLQIEDCDFNQNYYICEFD